MSSIITSTPGSAVALPYAPAGITRSRGELSVTVFAILVVAYLLPGLIGPHPWKPDEPYYFGIAYSMLKDGHWLVPTVAGEPFMEKPPLLAWTMAATAWLSSPWLAAHNGAKLAIGGFMAITLLCIGLTARAAFGRHSQARVDLLAMLALLGCIGLVQPSHAMLADVPLLTGFSMALYGLTILPARPRLGGAVLGTGIGVGFMSKGLIAPGGIGIAILLLPILFPAWRTRAMVRGILFAALFALPWLLIWPLALWQRAPSLFVELFWNNNFGRFFGFSVPELGATKTPGHWQETLPWFTFPALPLSAWSLWKLRARLAAHAGAQACLALFVATMAVLAVSASGRVIYALPLLAPLAVLAVPALESLPAAIEASVDWAARIFFGATALFAWGIWLITAWTGSTPQLSLLARHLPMDYPFAYVGWELAAAAVVGAAWIALLPRLRACAHRGLVSWVAGLALVSGTTFTLLLPWIDAAKSYRIVFQELRQALPEKYGCLASQRMGESERAMLHYELGLVTQRVESDDAAACDLLLFHGTVKRQPLAWLEKGWQITWQGARPGEHRERFWLLRRP